MKQFFRYFILMFLSSLLVLQACQTPKINTVNENNSTLVLQTSKKATSGKLSFSKPNPFNIKAVTGELTYQPDTRIFSPNQTNLSVNYDMFNNRSYVLNFNLSHYDSRRMSTDPNDTRMESESLTSSGAITLTETLDPDTNNSYIYTGSVTVPFQYAMSLDYFGGNCICNWYQYISGQAIVKATIKINAFLHTSTVELDFNGIGSGFGSTSGGSSWNRENATLKGILNFTDIPTIGVSPSSTPTPSPTPTPTATATPTPYPTIPPPPSPNPAPEGGGNNNSDKPNMEPIYPSKGKPENCMSSITADGKPTIGTSDGKPTPGAGNANWGNNPYTVAGVYDFDNRPGKANINIVLRPNSRNGGESNLDNLKSQVKVNVNDNSDNLLIKEDDSKSPIYDHKTKNERTNIIKYDASVDEHDINFQNNLGEIATMEQVAYREKNEFKNQILSDLAKNTKSSVTNYNPKNGATVNEIDNKGNALSYLDRRLAHSCCIYTNTRDVYIPVLAINLKNTYDSMSVGDSKNLTISGLPNGKTIILKITKKDPKSGNNWDISCPLNK